MTTRPLPPQHDADAHPAIDEASGLRPAYDRAVERYGNRMETGRVVDADHVTDAIEAFVRVEQGTSWKEAGIPGIPARVSQDVRGYYETAALGPSDHVPAAWAGTRWFLDRTETGKVVLGAREAMRDAGVKGRPAARVRAAMGGFGVPGGCGDTEHGNTNVYLEAVPVYTRVVTKRLIDVDDDALDAARAKLGTLTIKDTVNEALRTAARERSAELASALSTLAEVELDDRSAAWR